MEITAVATCGRVSHRGRQNAPGPIHDDIRSRLLDRVLCAKFLAGRFTTTKMSFGFIEFQHFLYFIST